MENLKTIDSRLSGEFKPLPIEIPAEQSRNIEVEITDIADIPALGLLWQDLQTRSQHSFFTSWGWIGSWLAHLPKEIRPQLLHARYNGKTMGLGVLTLRRIRKYKMFPANRLLLHETGNPHYDQLTIEHNGILADKSMSRDVLQKCIEFIGKRKNADELLLAGLEENNAVFQVNSAAIQKAKLTMKQPCYFVDLNKLRSEGKSYLSALSANTRYQIKRCLREFEKQGAIEITVATTRDQAMAFFTDLKELHQAYWRKKGQPGAFANAFFENFHRDLIEARFPHGEIQLVKTAIGSHTIGYLYNFIKDGHVYNYQSGFNYGQDKKLKPGIASHYHAIQHNLAQGAGIYDFLGGDSQYKKNLATASTHLLWALARFNRFKSLDWV